MQKELCLRLCQEVLYSSSVQQMIKQMIFSNRLRSKELEATHASALNGDGIMGTNSAFV